MSRYINPYTDFGFKKLFGEEANKDLLIDFLNSILPIDRQIASLSFGNPENLPDSASHRRAVFDIACQSIVGESFIVEMQKSAQHYFRDQSVFYSTFPTRNQAPKGEWDYNLQSVYFVAILNFSYDTDEDKKKFLQEVKLKAQDGTVFYDKLTYYFFQMPNFIMPAPDKVTQQDKWFYFLRNLDSFDDIPAILREPIFERAFDTAEYVHLPLAEQNRYEHDLKIYRDNYAVMKTAMKTATETGYAKGLADGQIKTVLTILQARFGQISESVTQSISDSAMLDALAVQAAKCMTLDEFNMSIPQR